MPTRFRQSVAVLAAALALLAAPGQLTAQSLADAARRAATDTRPQSEEEWIVTDIVSAIDDLAGMAAPPPPSRRRWLATRAPHDARVLERYDVRSDDGGRYAIEIPSEIWAPDAYAPFAAARLGGAPAPAVDRGVGILKALAEVGAANLERVNEDVSARLTANPRDAGAHAEAALVLAAFALGEAAGPFTDTRRALSRATAHLAIFRALSPARQTASAVTANAALLALKGRQADAVKRIAVWMKADDPTLRAWAHAITMRATGDWRGVSDPAALTPLERVEYFRALRERISELRALKTVAPLTPGEDLAFGRITGQWRPSVEAGNMHAERGLVGELLEASTILHVRLALEGREAPSWRAMVDRLNDERDAGPVGPDGATRSIRVIDAPLWAAFYQRHLANRIVTAVDHEYRVLGLIDSGTNAARSLESAFGAMRLYPLAKRRYAFQVSQYADAMKDGARLAGERPELVTALNWVHLETKSEFGPVPPGMPVATRWFRFAVPAGTAYDAASRVILMPNVVERDPSIINGLRSFAPYDRDLARYMLQAMPTTDVVEAERRAGDLAQYDAGFLGFLLRGSTIAPAAYLSLGERACALNASFCWNVADYLAGRGRDDEAARWAERWVASADDEVSVANGIGWLVDYYFDHGNRDRAIELAERAAAAYSYQGLSTKARLLERLCKFDEAEALFKEADERYDDARGLAGFYLRRRRDCGDQYADRERVAMARVFPRGLEKFDRTGAGSPADGVAIRTSGAKGDEAGFKAGDIVVAFDGTRVHDYGQFLVMWSASDEPRMTLTVWRDDHYLEVGAELRRRWPGSYFEDYVRPGVGATTR